MMQYGDTMSEKLSVRLLIIILSLVYDGRFVLISYAQA